VLEHDREDFAERCEAAEHRLAEAERRVSDMRAQLASAATRAQEAESTAEKAMRQLANEREIGGIWAEQLSMVRDQISKLSKVTSGNAEDDKSHQVQVMKDVQSLREHLGREHNTARTKQPGADTFFTKMALDAVVETTKLATDLLSDLTAQRITANATQRDPIAATAAPLSARGPAPSGGGMMSNLSLWKK
jgi:flagellar biosynthesis chaperone FliJ